MRSSAPARSNPLRLGGEVLACFRPGVCTHKAFDVAKVDRADDYLCGVPAAKPLIHGLVDKPVVFGGRLVAHAAEHAYCLHLRQGTDVELCIVC